MQLIGTGRKAGSKWRLAREFGGLLQPELLQEREQQPAAYAPGHAERTPESSVGNLAERVDCESASKLWTPIGGQTATPSNTLRLRKWPPCRSVVRIRDHLSGRGS